MGQIAWISVFMIVALPIDINDNRRHVHVFYRGKRDQECCAKFCNHEGYRQQLGVHKYSDRQDLCRRENS